MSNDIGNQNYKSNHNEKIHCCVFFKSLESTFTPLPHLVLFNSNLKVFV